MQRVSPGNGRRFSTPQTVICVAKWKAFANRYLRLRARRVAFLGSGTRLAARIGMLIRRCVWHREYHGYPMLYGIASWRGWRPYYSDGLCRRCAQIARAEWDIPLPERARHRPLHLDGFTVTASIMVVLLLVATRAVDDQESIRRMTHEAALVPPLLTPALPSPLSASPPTAPSPRPEAASLHAPVPISPLRQRPRARPLRVVPIATAAPAKRVTASPSFAAVRAAVPDDSLDRFSLAQAP